MTLDRCAYCSRPAVHRHHPTGRGADGGYLDPAFVVALDVRCHATEHVAWRGNGIAELTDPLKARLARLAWLTGRLADLDRGLGPTEMRGLNEVLIVCLDLVEAAP